MWGRAAPAACSLGGLNAFKIVYEYVMCRKVLAPVFVRANISTSNLFYPLLRAALRAPSHTPSLSHCCSAPYFVCVPKGGFVLAFTPLFCLLGMLLLSFLSLYIWLLLSHTPFKSVHSFIWRVLPPLCACMCLRMQHHTPRYATAGKWMFQFSSMSLCGIFYFKRKAFSRFDLKIKT